MPQYVVTYLQEATQTVNAPDIMAAGALAQQYARDHKGLQVQSVYLGAKPVALPPAV